jgi:hypothetical protein
MANVQAVVANGTAFMHPDKDALLVRRMAPFHTIPAKFDPAQAAAAIVRDMPDPTHEQLQVLINALSSRLQSMDERGCYDGLLSVIDKLDEACDALDAVVCHTDGRPA